MELTAQLEGLLFYRSVPVKKAGLSQLLNLTEEQLEVALSDLTTRLETGGTRLLITDKEVQLVTAPELDELIESIRRDELNRDIGRAGAETLAIILYREPVSRAEIDLIRGVNSSFILRNLMIRGLINRSMRQDGLRSYFYSITPSLLAHLGITKKTDLPGYEEMTARLNSFVAKADDKFNPDEAI